MYDTVQDMDLYVPCTWRRVVTTPHLVLRLLLSRAPAIDDTISDAAAMQSTLNGEGGTGTCNVDDVVQKLSAFRCVSCLWLVRPGSLDELQV